MKTEVPRFALVIYYPYGFPDIPTSLEVMDTLLAMGIPILEVGYPFSDPVADGPTIQRAVAWALRHRPSLQTFFDDICRLHRAWPDRALYLMTYLNPLHRLGVDRAAQFSAYSGLRGWIVPDLPYEEAEPVARTLESVGLHLVLLASNNLSDERLEKITRRTRGFLYAISTLGVTGVRERLDPVLETFLDRIRRWASVPVYVGFGIARPEHVEAVADRCDGVIVGSAVIQAVLDHPDRPVEVVRQVVAPLWETVRAVEERKRRATESSSHQ